MKFYSLATFLFMLQVSMNLINVTGIFDINTQKTPNTEWYDIVSTTNLENAQYAQSQVNAQYSFGFGDFIKGIFYFVLVIGASLVLPGYVFSQFGVPIIYSAILSIPFYYSYIMAIVQFMSNRSFKQQS